MGRISKRACTRYGIKKKIVATDCYGSSKEVLGKKMAQLFEQIILLFLQKQYQKLINQKIITEFFITKI